MQGKKKKEGLPFPTAKAAAGKKGWREGFSPPLSFPPPSFPPVSPTPSSFLSSPRPQPSYMSKASATSTCSARRLRRRLSLFCWRLCRGPRRYNASTSSTRPSWKEAQGRGLAVAQVSVSPSSKEGKKVAVVAGKERGIYNSRRKRRRIYANDDDAGRGL